MAPTDHLDGAVGTHLSASPVRIPTSSLGHQQRGQEEDSPSICVASHAVTLTTNLGLCPGPEPGKPLTIPSSVPEHGSLGLSRVSGAWPAHCPGWWLSSLHRPDTPEVGSELRALASARLVAVLSLTVKMGKLRLARPSIFPGT